MVNQWVQFVRQYAKDNNISYGCAISEAGPAYRNMKKELNEMDMEDFDAPNIVKKKQLKNNNNQKLKTLGFNL